jgi:uncharacterized OsmC-like protein
MITATAIVNGVNTEALKQTVEAVKADSKIAKFEFRLSNQWINGGHNRSKIQGFYGAGQEDSTRTKPFVVEADEPPVLLGEDHGANPVEFVLHALASCLTTSMVYHAAARGIQIEELESKLEGDIDLRGFLGLSPDIRKGYQNIRVTMRAKSNATPEQLRELCEMSPVFDIVRNPVPVTVNVEKK